MKKRPVQADVTYAIPYVETPSEDGRQVLDLYVPKGEGPFPVVVWIHGGGWAQGDRKVDFAPLFLEVGLALASLEYRLTSEGHPFPAQIEDCMAAVSWLKKHGEDYGLDVERMGVTGHSAGGHLSALVAVAGESGIFSPERVKVQASVLLSPPLDLGRERGKWPGTFFIWDPRDQFSTKFFSAGVYDEGFAIWASPSSYLHPQMPPALIIHGEKDDIVPIAQAQEFQSQALLLGAEVAFQNQKEANHDLQWADTMRQTVDFFSKTL